MVLDGDEMPVRPNLGLFTQPISFIGLPVAAVPVWTDGRAAADRRAGHRRAWREDLALRVARFLEARGVVSAPIARIELTEMTPIERELIATDTPYPQPPGVAWDRIRPDRSADIPFLTGVRAAIETRKGAR